MKKGIVLLIILFLSATVLFAQENSGKEITNTVSAVKAANPGDYIILPSGKKYTLTKEEIAIVKGEFDYEDLSGLEVEIDENGMEKRIISQAHIAYVFPDGQATHILKTSVSFTAFLRHIQNTFYLTPYIDLFDDMHDYIQADPPSFQVFRARVQYQTISDGIDELQAINITVYNYEGENIFIKYCSAPEMVWGNVSEKGSYKPIGESHK